MRKAAVGLGESRAWPDIHHYAVSADRQRVTCHIEILHTSTEPCHKKQRRFRGPLTSTLLLQFNFTGTCCF